ncbi:MAG: FtsX-like permease family protein, partial [Myxococcota bacterium]
YGSRAGRARTKEFRVAGVFHSGMFEFDSRMSFIALREAQRFFRQYDTVTGLDVWTDDATESLGTILTATRQLDPDDPWAYEVKDWSITNRSVFGAVQQQKLLISLFLFLIVVVASCMIMATLILLILEKSREVAVLKALGARTLSIYMIFILDGVIIGVVGCLVGLATGLGACAVLQQYGLRLDPRVYYLEHLPIVVRPSELAIVCLGALVLAIAAAAVTSLMAAGVKPVDGLTQRLSNRASSRRRGRGLPESTQSDTSDAGEPAVVAPGGPSAAVSPGDEGRTAP